MPWSTARSRPGSPRPSLTFDPHPRVALGNQVELITTLERRLELFAEAGAETTLVAAFTPELMRLEPEEFAESYLRRSAPRSCVAGEDFRFGARRRATWRCSTRLGFRVMAVPEVPGVSSTAIRAALAAG